jgi:hypothetical protein
MNQDFESVLGYEFWSKDIGCVTVRQYLCGLTSTLLRQGYGFSAKRPFGSSDWLHSLAIVIGRAGAYRLHEIDHGEDDIEYKIIDWVEVDHYIEKLVRYVFFGMESDS